MIDVADLITNSKKIVILSGAGLSKASGIPTYRGAGGLWLQNNPDKVSSADADMEEVSVFYQKIYSQYFNCLPNAAHFACAELTKIKEVTHVTQNVDGLLTVAGCGNVIEIHGNISKWYCSDCSSEINIEDGDTCLSCGSKKIRPDVVLFGEFLDEEKISKIKNAISNCDVVFTVGTSGVVFPFAGFVSAAHGRGKPVVAINPEQPENHFDYWLAGNAEDVLPAIVNDLMMQ